MLDADQGLIVIGASAGGMEALLDVVAEFKAALPAAVLVVQHMAPTIPRSIVDRIRAASVLPATFANDGDALQAGRIYMAQPDHHLLIQDGRLSLTRGPRVNNVRPAIDLTMRAAAVTSGSAAVGVVLSGMLDDGMAGLSAIARCGGRTLVQDPNEALFDEMPRNALSTVEADWVLPARALGRTLDAIVRTAAPAAVAIPDVLRMEYELDLKVQDVPAVLEELGEQVPLSCPECGGPLWEITPDGPPRYRCHVGHGLSPQSMLTSMDGEVEAAMWVALRTLEERARMQDRLAAWESERGGVVASSSFEERANDTKRHADRIRRVLLEVVQGSDRVPIEPAA